MPTADEPTDANKKTAQRIRDLLAKEKKPVKEEAEELDESAKIAAHLIKRYGDNVRKSHVVSAANDFGVDASKLAKAVRTKLGKTSLAEEEQIDELSVAKLKDYRTKARADAYDADDVDDERRYRKRAAGSNTAGKKIVRQGGNLKEEPLDELSSKKLTDYMDKASDARGHRNLSTKKVDNRYAGVKKASDKITTEEQMSPEDHYKADLPHILKDIRGKRKGHSDLRREYGGSWKRLANSTAAEHGHNYNRSHLLAVGKQHMDKHMQEEVQIDELSKATMGRYINKAKNSIDLTAWRQGHKEAGAGSPSRALERKLSKRHIGIEKAVNKLTKEDIINRTIEKYVPEDLKFTPEERLLKRLDGLSEAHVNTLMGLFEALNSDNQNKMIATVESREGINQLLNFALDNRGE
jgi:hypothetical protein